MIRFIINLLALTILLLAIPASGQSPTLPSTMVMTQRIGAETWAWTMTRRGGQSVYDGVARNVQNGVLSNHVFELRSFDGKTVVFFRPDAGTYTGTVTSDGRTINGRTSFGGSNEGWQIALPPPMVEKVDPAPPAIMVEKADPVRGAAQPAPGLAARLTIRQWVGNDSWTWTLTRRGNGTLYDAAVRHDQSGGQSNHVFDMRSFDGKTLVFYRNDAGFYNGKVSADGRQVQGTVDFAGGGWSMNLDDGTAIPAGGAAAAAPMTGIRYRVENLVFKAPDAYQNPRNLHDYMVDFSRCMVRPMVSEAVLATLRVEVHVCRPGSRLSFTQTSIETGAVVDYDWALLDGGRTVSGAWRQSAGFGPSVGAQVVQ